MWSNSYKVPAIEHILNGTYSRWASCPSSYCANLPNSPGACEISPFSFQCYFEVSFNLNTVIMNYKKMSGFNVCACGDEPLWNVFKWGVQVLSKRSWHHQGAVQGYRLKVPAGLIGFPCFVVFLGGYGTSMIQGLVDKENTGEVV